MHPPPDNIARELREAALINDYEKAQRLTNEYASAVRRYWALLSPEERASSRLPTQSLDLLSWVRTVTLTQQAIDAQHLAFFQKADRYRTARVSYLQSARMEAFR